MAVRLATEDDAGAIAHVQARSYPEKLVRILQKPLSSATSAQFDEKSFEAIWATTLHHLSPYHRVLVATHGDLVVGFATVAPTEPVPATQYNMSTDHSDALSNKPGTDQGARSHGSGTPASGSTPQAPVAYELAGFDVIASHLGNGHHARLLAAATDIIREAGGTEVYIWALAGDDVTTRYLDEAGFAPRGFARGYEIDAEQVTEQLWWATL